MGLARAVSIESRTSIETARGPTSDEGGEEGWVVVVNQRHLVAECVLVCALNFQLDLAIKLFVGFVLRIQMLKPECQKRMNG